MKPFRRFEDKIYEVIRDLVTPGEVLEMRQVDISELAGYSKGDASQASLALHTLELRGFIKKVAFKKYMRII